MDSRAIQHDIQTERKFILASEDNRLSTYAKPRGNFDMLPNALSTGAHLEDSPGAWEDEHLNKELEAGVLLDG